MTWLLDSVIKLTLTLKIVSLCIYGTVLFCSSYLCSFFLSFLYSVISCSSNKTLLVFKLGSCINCNAWNCESSLTRAFCNRNNDAVETSLICTKHCKGIVTDPLWQIFRLRCLFSFWDEKASLIYFTVGSRRWAQCPLKKCFGVFPAVFLCSSFLWYLVIFKIHPFGCILGELLGQLCIFRGLKPKCFWSLGTKETLLSTFP